MKRSLFLLMGLLSTSWAAEIPLWEAGAMPGKVAALPGKGDHVLRLTHVGKPTLSFYPAKEGDCQSCGKQL